MSYGRTYAEQRFSPLAQINTDNVNTLGLAWSYDLKTQRGIEATSLVVDGVMYTTSAWSIVYALDARSGAPCTGFGKAGTIDLNSLANFGVGQVSMSSPPAVFENLVIVGSAIGDNVRNDMPHGIVRAFDARTGAQVWSWDPIPAAVANKTGAGNTWAPISIDTSRGLVMLPTSSPSPDYWGGDRTAEMPYTTSVAPLLTTVPTPLAPELTISLPPLLRTVALAAP